MKPIETDKYFAASMVGAMTVVLEGFVRIDETDDCLSQRSYLLGRARDLIAQVSARRETVAHFHDSDCTPDSDDCCTECGTYHGDPCPECEGRGFHEQACSREG